MTGPDFAEIVAPAAWRTVDLLADLHLQADEPATFEAWRGYLETTPADAVFFLGDLFELWVGDDAADSDGFEAECAALLRRAAERRPLFFMHGNRDFLVGAAFAAGIANGLLEAVDVSRARLMPLPVPVRGLAEIQALEFSLSAADPGMRAVLEVHGLAVDAARARPDVPRSPSFDAFVAQSQPAPLDHRTLRSLADELERIVLTPGATDAAPSPSNNSQETR